MKYYNTPKSAKVEVTTNRGQGQVPIKGNPANCFYRSTIEKRKIYLNSKTLDN